MNSLFPSGAPCLILSIPSFSSRPSSAVLHLSHCVHPPPPSPSARQFSIRPLSFFLLCPPTPTPFMTSFVPAGYLTPYIVLSKRPNPVREALPHSFSRSWYCPHFPFLPRSRAIFPARLFRLWVTVPPSFDECTTFPPHVRARYVNDVDP